ncbi:MAG TPA: GNAT family N-acetyltransferase [Candidatus Bathyarchaeia archaeon]|nr:GNAT family N-acetyltransferase [Candidatus Bathyarchaeia archaeon]
MSEGSIEYRELRWADFPSYHKLMLQASGEFERVTGFDHTVEAFFKYLHRRRLWTLLALIQALGRAPIHFFVAVDQGQVIGSASLILLPRTGYIFAVVTDSAHRNRGIASHILEQAHEVARKQGKRWAALDVDTNNQTAIRVYRKLGYEEKARFNWHVGPTPEAVTHSVGMATEVPRSKMKEEAAWVNLHQSDALHEPLPATAKMFSHHENITQLPDTQTKTWSLSSSGQTIAVARGFFLPIINTVFVIPAGWDSAITSDLLLSLVAPPLNWARSLDVTRTEIVVPDPPGAWEKALDLLGLPQVVSTILMVRPL